MAFDFSAIGGSDMLGYIILNNSPTDFLVSGIFFLLGLALLKIFELIVVQRLKALSKRTHNTFDDALIRFLSSVHLPYYLFFAVFASLKYLTLPNFLDEVLGEAFFIVIVIIVVKFISAIIDFVIERRKEKDNGNKSLLNFMSRFLKVIVWVIALLTIISNLGIDIISLVAGLGIGGIAIAFALQSILEDLFSAFSIYFDKPFEVGDFIVIGDDLGTVEEIGLKTTRIKHIKGHELVISNRELTSSRIHNYKKIERRRVLFQFGVEYDTPVDKLKKIKQVVSDLISKHEFIELDRVHFKEMGDSSLKFEVVYFLNSSDYMTYVDLQEKILLELMAQMKKMKVEFAFPTQTIFVKK